MARRTNTAQVVTELNELNELDSMGPLYPTEVEDPADLEQDDIGPTEIEPAKEAVVDHMKMSALELISMFGNKSKAIRALHGMGHKTGPISKVLGLRYQHVRNVLVTPVKAV